VSRGNATQGRRHAVPWLPGLAKPDFCDWLNALFRDRSGWRLPQHPSPPNPPVVPGTSAVVAQEHVVSGIGNAEIGALRFARPLRHAPFGVDALDSRGFGQYAAAAMFDDVEPEPGNII